MAACATAGDSVPAFMSAQLLDFRAPLRHLCLLRLRHGPRRAGCLAEVLADAFLQERHAFGREHFLYQLVEEPALGDVNSDAHAIGTSPVAAVAVTRAAVLATVDTTEGAAALLTGEKSPEQVPR
jgi:hypothetical protein